LPAPSGAGCNVADARHQAGVIFCVRYTPETTVTFWPSVPSNPSTDEMNRATDIGFAT
jgi:hypothetical protein